MNRGPRYRGKEGAGTIPAPWTKLDAVGDIHKKNYIYRIKYMRRESASSVKLHLLQVRPSIVHLGALTWAALTWAAVAPAAVA